MTPAEACKRLIAAESLQEIYKRSKSHPSSCDVDSPHESPSGTPPPPYRGVVGKNLCVFKATAVILGIFFRILEVKDIEIINERLRLYIFFRNFEFYDFPLSD